MKDFKSKYLNFYPVWHHFSFQFNVAGYFDPRPHFHICLGWGQIFLYLPFKTKYDECDPPVYGIYYYEDGIWLNLGRKVKCFHMPWELDWVRTSNLRHDGTWEHERRGDRKEFWDKEKWNAILWSETYPYRYVLKSGTVQERSATVRVEEREWRPRWFKWTKKFAYIRKSISVEFNDEVGERTGSWKGGTIGCGYDILPTETPLQCLRRMEKERKF
jgi:hypothetical protein